MAAADYRLCDVCESKAFYDANLDYVKTEPGHPEYPNMVPDGVGAWAVLCTSCAETHEVMIRPRRPITGYTEAGGAGRGRGRL